MFRDAPCERHVRIPLLQTTACDVYVCPSALHVGLIYKKFNEGILVTPQNCNFKVKPTSYLSTLSLSLSLSLSPNNSLSPKTLSQGCGAFTGEMAAEQMVDMGMKWCLIGHSERRGEFDLPTPAESNELMATKMAYLISQGINVIYAIGEPLPVREKGLEAVMENLIPQLEPCKAMLDPAKVVIAYEPVWSIGTGVTASPEQAQETHKAIREWIAKSVSAEAAQGMRIQYGGSANAKNAPDLSKCPDIDGFLVGGASLKPEFVQGLQTRALPSQHPLSCRFLTANNAFAQCTPQVQGHRRRHFG